jgi:hypothetical protein
MKQPLLSCSLLFLAFFFPALAPTGRAADYYGLTYPDSQSFAHYTRLTAELPVERAGHSFAVYFNGVKASQVFVYGWIRTTSETGANATVRSLLLLATIPTGVTVTSWKIVDTTAQQEIVRTGVPTGVTSLVDAAWTTVSGVPNRYFAIPNSRVGHGLFFGSPSGGWTRVSPMNRVGVKNSGQPDVLLPWQTMFATAPAGSSNTDYLVDRTTGEKTAVGVGDARLAASWTPDPDVESYPLSWVQVGVHKREAGHVFTVHGTTPGSPEQLVRVTAWTDGTDGFLNFALGTGMRFWISRDAEDGAPAQPTAPDPQLNSGSVPPEEVGLWTASPTASFDATSRFPAIPVRANQLVVHEFRINARTRPGHTFIVKMNDGYSSTFGPVATGTVSAYASNLLDGWLSNGLANPLPIYTFSAWVDPWATITLVDQTDGTQLGISAVGGNRTDWLDGWQPTLTIPNPGAVAAIDLQLPSAHVMDLFEIRPYEPDPDDLWSSSYLGTTSYGTSRTFLGLVNNDPILRSGINLTYYLESSTVSFAHPRPAAAGPFILRNLYTGQRRDGIFPGLNQLSEWFEPPKPIVLQISSSRQGHRLVVRHPNGEFFPIQNGDVAGNTSAPPTGPASWYQSYYYFDALAVARSEMPRYVEDLDTGEMIGPDVPLTGPAVPSSTSFSSSGVAASTPINPAAGPSNAALINWIAAPTPGPLTGQIVLDGPPVTSGSPYLWWPLSYGTSDQGSYDIERKLGGQNWENLTRIAASTVNSNNMLQYDDPAPRVGYVHSYRVRYVFGMGSSEQRSVPSNVVVISGFLDDDGDGIPNYLDGPDGPPGGDDADGDGVPDLDDPNPAWKDNPVVGLTVFGYVTY